MIKTKLFIPQFRHNLVRRPRLSALLEQAAHCPLTLVSSLAGSGKTTALAEWVRQISIPAAWFSIDEGDNDLTRFLSYFVSALQTAVPDAGRAVLEALRSPEPLSIENLMALLINDLAETRPDFVLVLDDYHLIKSRAIHKAIFLLVEHMPSPVHLVIATRADPNLPLARLRARNMLLDLRLDQLRFTPEETTEYLNRTMRLGLSQDDVDRLWTRTEGWIASLQMAAVSLQTQTDEKAFIRAFSGSNRYLFDYLVEEVLNRQPEEIQAFLLETCILDRMCAALCDAVTGKESGQKTLEYLERNNLFLMPLDDERSWYRYHHLFLDLLRARAGHAHQRKNQKARQLRASAWYEAEGFFEEAIRHALAAEDYPRAAELVERAAESAWFNGQYALILAWIRALPEALVHRHPRLCIWTAWAHTQTGSLQEVQAWITAAELAAAEQAAAEQAAEKQAAKKMAGDLFRSPGESSWEDGLADEIAILHAFAACLAQDVDRSEELAARLLKNPASQNKKAARFARGNILHALSSMYYAAGELAKAEQTCLETIRLSREIGFPLRHIHAVNKLAYISKTTGQLSRSYRLLQDTLFLFQQQGVVHYFAAGSLRCRLIDLLYEWNRLEEAQHTIDDELRPEMLAAVPYLWADRYNIQARNLLWRKDFSGAQSALDQAAILAQQAYIWPGLTWQTEAIQVRLWLQTGEAAQAAALVADRMPADQPDRLLFSTESYNISRARILLAQGACAEAAGLLKRLANAAAVGERRGSLVAIHTLQAIALHGMDETGQAVPALENALALAEPEGYVRTFLDEGSGIGVLLSQLVREERSPHLSYAVRLLAAFEHETGSMGPEMRPAGSRIDRGAQASGTSGAALIEPLSKRELEVLRCMAEGLSNAETARRLVIETSTVKRHINSIFAKLGVINRVQAINQAKECGLL